MNRLLLVLCLSLSCLAFTPIEDVQPKKPNVAQTPGELCDQKDPDFIGYRYKQKVAYCERNVSYFQRVEIYEKYKVPAKLRSEYTIDHFIPLSIGGSNHPSNLWPEHKKIKALRPELEQKVFEAVRDNKMSQDEAIEVIQDAKLNPPLK